MEIHVAFPYKNQTNLHYSYICKKKMQTNFRKLIHYNNIKIAKKRSTPPPPLTLYNT